MLSRLKPDTAVLVAGVTALGVVAIYTNSVPNLSDIRSAPANDDTVEKERRKAAVEAAVLVVGVSIISRDLTPWIIGGIMLVGLDLMIKHSNATNPNTGMLDVPNLRGYGNATANLTAVPDYTVAG